MTAVENEAGGGLFQAGRDGARSFDPHNTDAADAGWISEGLASRDERRGAAKQNCAVERGDGRGLRIDGAEVLGAFPDPQSSLGKRVHPPARRREVESMRRKRQAQHPEGNEAHPLLDTLNHCEDKLNNVRNRRGESRGSVHRTE